VSGPAGKRITILMPRPRASRALQVLHDIYKMAEGDYGKYFLQAASLAASLRAKDVAGAAQMKEQVTGNAGRSAT